MKLMNFKYDVTHDEAAFDELPPKPPPNPPPVTEEQEFSCLVFAYLRLI